MKAERNDPSVWKELYEWGKQLAADVDIEPTMPRTAGRQQRRVTEYPSRNARDVLAKSRAFSPCTRTKWQASVTRGSFVRTIHVLCSSKAERFQQRGTMPVSIATPKRSFCTDAGVKTYLVRSTMKTERLAALALMHALRDMPIYVEAVIRELCAKKNRLAFEFLWVPPRFLGMFFPSQVIKLLLLLWPQPQLAAFC